MREDSGNDCAAKKSCRDIAQTFNFPDLSFRFKAAGSDKICE